MSRMKWKISIIENKTVALIESEGIMTVDSINQLAKETKGFVNKNGLKKIIVDHRKVTLNLTFMELYERPVELNKTGELRSVRIAEIIPEKHKKEFKFFETVTRNRGYQIMTFDDFDSALKWLHKE